jgi:hypothetical protein
MTHYGNAYNLFNMICIFTGCVPDEMMPKSNLKNKPDLAKEGGKKDHQHVHVYVACTKNPYFIVP